MIACSAKKSFKPGGHGEAGHWQPGRQEAHGHEVVSKDLVHTWSAGRLVLEKALNQVSCKRSNPAGDVVLVLLDPRVGVLQGLRLEGRLAHEQGVEDAANAPHVHLCEKSKCNF